VNFQVGTPNFALTGSLTTARADPTATLLDNGAVLVAGGFNPFTGTLLSSAELYSPVTGSFVTTGALNIARLYYTATLLPNGRALITGGFASSYTPVGTAELYDSVSGTFTVSGTLNDPRGGHTATLLNTGKVLIAGGLDSNPFTQGISCAAGSELYDPAAQNFVSTGSLNTGRCAQTATLLNDGKVLIAGGDDSNSNVLSSAELYDPATGTFALTGSLNIGRSGPTATLLNNGLVLIAGGQDSNGNNLANAELYDPATGSFALTGAINTPRSEAATTLLNNGTVLLIGGADSTSYPLATAELYDPVAGAFSVTGSMHIVREELTATLLTNGQVLVAGGIDNSNDVLTSAELYQPSTLGPTGLVSIAVSPSNPTAAVGENEHFTATGTFSDSSTQTLASVTWHSSDSAIAIIANSANDGSADAIATGSATISACAGSICGSTTLTVLPPPSITSLSPTFGLVGSSVTITGTGFGPSQGTSTVTFNGTPATSTSWSMTTIVVQVPTGATTGNVVVTVNGQASSGVSFAVGQQTNSPIMYTYDDLGRLIGVVDAFGNGAAYSYDAVGNILSISRVIPGQLSIIGFSPSQGPIGTTVTISGTGFSTTASQNAVQFNGVAATVTSATATQIVTSVPSGANTGAIGVTAPGGSANSGSSFTVTSSPDNSRI
jgi:YD repeat-containing protein